MGALYHNGHWYGGGQDIDIQSDPQATSLNAGEVPTGDTTANYIKKLLEWKTAQTDVQWVNGTYNFISGVDISDSNEIMLILTYIGTSVTTKRQSYIFPTSALLDGSIFWDVHFANARLYMGLSSNGTQITVSNATTQSNSIRFDILYR